MAKILLAEDDVTFAEMVRDWLERDHHVVEMCHDGNDALERLKLYGYDALILDWQMPGMSGVDLLKAYRDQGGIAPVLMLTGRDSVANKMTGLDGGADDYLTKPCDLREVSARLRALLRRPSHFQGTVLTVAHLTLNPESFAVTVDGKPVELMPKEFALLEFFMRNPNRVFNQEAILAHVWKAENEVGPETVRVWVKRLRKKIDIDPDNSIIQSIYGLGYKLVDESKSA
ncbi:MAG: response regulator transcription factor [Cyanobacteria bacterium SZAS LIN-3]|nr:response regulator transcription factor [Cyanobacteria bacterium SZAS LIN-3]